MNEDREANLLRSVTETTWRFYAWVALLAAVVLWGLVAYVQQLRQGLIVTGLRDQISWGLYITNFVFFIGISHAGTLISAILRVTKAEWRRPVTRMAEGITVFALCIGAPMVIVDLGRPDRLLNVLRYGRIQSPILWDVLSISTYLTGCFLFFYLPLIPDVAALSNHQQLAPWRRRLYRALSLGWTDTPAERKLLEKAIAIMAVMIIPLAVSVHTVVSWIFSMTLRPGWDSSIFGPYFVVGAIFSGTAAVILSMYIIRRVFRLETYLETLHFRNLGILLLTFALLYLYFNINEYLTVGYKFPGMEKTFLDRMLFGDYSPYFWTVQTMGVFIPIVLLLALLTLKSYQRFVIPGVALASLLVVAGAWAKRYLIVVPTLATPFLPAQNLPAEWVHYRPTWVEWSITAAAFAGFLLIYTLLAKLFPIVSIWETRAEEAEAFETKPQPAAPPARPVWRPIAPAILIVGLFWGTPSADAASAQVVKRPQTTVLTVDWQPAAPHAAPTKQSQDSEPGESPRVYFLTGQLFSVPGLGSSPHVEEEPTPAIAIRALLRDEQGLPLSFQAVGFALETSFGTLPFGNWPTNAQGKAELIVRDRRSGKYLVEVAYSGDDAHGNSRAETWVDFGPRPGPALPQEGVLITPYPTAAIGLPFLLFYGSMWVAFAYVFGYLVLRRLPQSRAKPGVR